MIELNQRVYSRILQDEPGRILIDGHSELLCFIRDLSTGGAGLELDPVAALPQQFGLIHPNADLRSCRIVWRFGDRVGIVFDDVSAVSAMCDGTRQR